MPTKGMNFEEQVGEASISLILQMAYLEGITCQGLEVEFRKFSRLHLHLENVLDSKSSIVVCICSRWYITMVQGTLRLGVGLYSRLVCHLLPYKNQND